MFKYRRVTLPYCVLLQDNLPPGNSWARDLRSTKKRSVSSPKDFPKIVIDSDRISCYSGNYTLPAEAI
jgi:hypothetical protein